MRIAVSLLLSVFATLAQAEDHFKFQRLTCDPKISEVKITPVRLWNMKDRVWGDTWEKHIALMKALEKEHQLYVFDQDYGYTDTQKQIAFRCGTVEAIIKFEHYTKKSKGPEPAREVRINPTVFFSIKGRSVTWNPLWTSTEAGMNAYGVSLNEKSTETNVFRVKLSEDPADVTCCAKGDTANKR